MSALVLSAAYSTAADFLSAFDAEVTKSGLLVRGADAGGAAAMSACALRVSIAGAVAAEVPARVAAAIPGVGVAVMFDGVPQALARLAEHLRAGGSPPDFAGAAALGGSAGVASGAAAGGGSPGDAAPEAGDGGAGASAGSGGAEAEEAAAEGGPVQPAQGPLVERLKAMNVTQKMQLALSGSREERMQLFRDVNKVIHVYVLRNPRIGLDEVQHAAKQPTLSPDALKMISEHREWGQNQVVCTALVRNPKTPLPIAIRLLDRIPMSEVRAIAKGGARDQIVAAARKKTAAG